MTASNMKTCDQAKVWVPNLNLASEGEGEGEVAVFSAKRWDRRSS